VLHSLATFLRHSLFSFSNTLISSEESPTSTQTWYLVSSFLNQEAYHSFNELLRPSEGSSQPRNRRDWQPEVDFGEGDDDFPHMIHFTSYLAFDDHWTLLDLVNSSAIKGSSEGEIIGGANITLVAVSYKLQIPCVFG
jgi:hypothetical protein